MGFLEKIVSSIVVAIVTVLSRYIYNILTGDSQRIKVRTSSIELIDRIISNRSWQDIESRLVVEEAFEQLYSKPLNFYEINALIYSETPNAAFRTYLRYRPVLELNKNKTKFQYKKGKRPYYCFFEDKIKVPLSIIKGLFIYALFAIPASYGMTYLFGDFGSSLSIKNLVILWFIVGCLWFLGVISLIEGLKYQYSETDILKNLGDKFQIIKHC